MENIVSCQGSDCNVCSLLETISNLYNYILGTSFALAVLILIIAGFAYLGSTGNKIFLEKSRLFLKGVLFGFVFILLGWLIIHAIIKFSGYINAGAWWQFRCNTENQQESIINDETDSYFSPFYKNLTVFPDLRSFLASGVEKGKVNGPLDQSSFAAQIQSLRDGEMLHFLAPVRLESTTGENEDLFLPLITLRKEGSDIVLENTGEYWDVFANKFKKSNSVTLNSLEIDGIIEPILIDSNGIPLENKADFDLISADIVKNLGKYVDGGDRTASKTESLSDLIAGAGDPKEKFNNIVSPLTIDFQKMVGSLIVERESSQKVPSFLQSQVDSCSNLMNTPKNCPPDQCVGENLHVYPHDNQICENGHLLPYSCSSVIFESACSKENSSNNGLSRSEESNNFVSSNQNGGNTKDSNGILTDYFEDDDIQSKPININGVVYNREDEINAALSSLSRVTAYKDQRGDSSSGSGSGSGSQKYELVDSAPRGNNTAEDIKKALKEIWERDKLRYEMIFRFVDKIDVFYLPSEQGGGSSESSSDSLSGGGAENINDKETLTQKEPSRVKVPNGLEYKCGYVGMNTKHKNFFDIEQTLVHEATHSGQECLYGEDFYNTKDDREIAERIAIANSIGSLCREKDADMTEFPEQTKGIEYKGREVRGYASRWSDKVNPKGFFDSKIVEADLGYARKFGPLVKGPYYYGDCEENIILGASQGLDGKITINKSKEKKILGLTQKEEDTLKSIVESKQKCRSKPTKGLPPVPACDGSPEIIIKKNMLRVFFK